MSYIDEYTASLPLEPRIKSLISQADWDLHYGPVVDDPQYPGFEAALSEIREALEDIDTVYYETWSGCFLASLPEPENIDGELIEPEYSEYREIPPEVIKQNLLGSLASYLSI